MFSAQDFAARLAAREDRWSLLKDFVAEWHAPLKDGDGYTAEEVDAAERRLGLKLPLALREYYLLAGQREDLVAKQNFLVSPDELEIEEGLLEFYCENQGVVHWGVNPDDLHLPDPPVYLNDDGLYGGERENIRQNETLSEFVLQMLVLETACFTEMGGNAAGDTNTAGIVQANFKPLGLPIWSWPKYSRLYGRDDVLVELDQGDDKNCWVWVAALTKEALHEAVKLLNLEWEYLYDGIPINEIH